ncbi:MAG TPA: DUF4412 domain-containing protein [Chitinophagales bacterium]
MKKILATVFALMTISVFAQTFEGSIKWAIQLNLSPAAQKQIAELSSPENIAKMQAMFSSPQMKAMLEKNPEMKAAFEAMQNGGNPFANLLPKAIASKVKADKTYTNMEGGITNGEYIFTPKENLKLNRLEKTYSAIPKSDADEKNKPDVKVEKTTETSSILGYTCTKYIVTMQEKGQNVTANVWATNDVKGIDIKAMAKQRAGKTSLFYEEIDGFPMRIETVLPQDAGSATVEVTELKNESVADSYFVVPSEFKEVALSYGSLLK